METTTLPETTAIPETTISPLEEQYLNLYGQQNAEMIQLQTQEIQQLENLNEGVAITNQLLIYLLLFCVVFAFCKLVSAFKKFFGMFIQ